MEYFIYTLIERVAFNGYMLINVGPSRDGTIAPIFVDRLMGICDWLSVNGNTIYATKPWKLCQNENCSLFLYQNGKDALCHVLFAITTKWPTKNRLVLSTLIASFVLNAIFVLFLAADESLARYCLW